MINHHAVDQPTVRQTGGARPESYVGRLRSGRQFYFRCGNGRATVQIESEDLAYASASIDIGDDDAGTFEDSEVRYRVFARLYRELVVTNWPGRVEPECWCPDAFRDNRVPVGYCPSCAYGSGIDGLCPDRCSGCLSRLDNGAAILAGREWIV